MIAPGVGMLVVYIDNQSIGKDVWFDNLVVDHYESEVLEEDHYYPHGLCLNMAPNTTGINPNPYKYNTKELETHFGLESYDYGARMFDPQLGVWHVPDPLAEISRRWSPYTYCYDNPIRFIDPTYRNDKGAEYGGTDVNIIFSKNNGEAQYEVGGQTVSLKQKSNMVLGGELIHALVAMDGHKDPYGDGSHVYTNIFGEKQVETRDRDELATHGMGKWHYNPSVYRNFYPSENDLRKENGEPRRVSYEDDLDYKYKPENKVKLEYYEKTKVLNAGKAD